MENYADVLLQVSSIAPQKELRGLATAMNPLPTASPPCLNRSWHFIIIIIIIMGLAFLFMLEYDYNVPTVTFLGARNIVRTYIIMTERAG